MIEPRRSSESAAPSASASTPEPGLGEVIDLTDSTLDARLPLDPDDDPTSYVDAQPGRVLGERPEDFASFYVRHRTTMTYVARRYVGDSRDADEVVQEAFLKIFLALPELPNELAALAYARRTVVNLCIDRLRASGRRPSLVDLDSVPEATLGLYEDDDVLVEAEDAAVVREALAKLSPLHRQALIMREVEERPLPEIAQLLDVPEEGVKHLLHRARKALRRLLAGSAVDPSVDLESLSFTDLVAQRPARITVLLLFVIGGVLGGSLTALGGGSSTDPSGAPLALAESPFADLAPHLGFSPALEAPTTTRSTPAHAPHTPAKGQSVPSTTTSETVTPSAPTQTSGTPGGTPASTPATPSAPITMSASNASRPIYVTGAGALTNVTVTGESRQLDSSGYTSSSTVSAKSAHGLLSIAQTLQSAVVDGRLVVGSATLNPVIPGAGGGSTGYLLTTQSVQTRTVAQGIEVVIQGLATPLAGDAGAMTVYLTAIYDSTLTAVLSETVRLGLPSGPEVRSVGITSAS